MEKHHLLRRDPTWHRDACNLCGQLGHQAANCTSGTVNWKGLYGEEAFLLRPPIYESDYQAMREAKKLDFTALETRSRDYARQKAEAAGDNYEAMLAAAEEMRRAPVKLPAPTPSKPEAEELPAGWAVAHDAAGKAYYWHKKTQKTMWEKPTADTPIN